MRKERAMSIVRKAILTLVALALVGWLGYSAYDIYDSNQERSVAEVNFDSVTEYLNGLSETE